ncbi:hypothetical protein ACE6H2_017011 [Prunus campanulata]
MWDNNEFQHSPTRETPFCGSHVEIHTSATTWSHWGLTHRTGPNGDPPITWHLWPTWSQTGTHPSRGAKRGPTHHVESTGPQLGSDTMSNFPG